MFCCISGLVPTDPVISRTSGHLFERALIEKALLEDSRCPVSGEPLTADDLISVQGKCWLMYSVLAVFSLALAYFWINVFGFLSRMSICHSTLTFYFFSSSLMLP
jgi:hypothetical protein